MRSDGCPSGVVVASAIALESLASLVRASANQLSNRAMGSSVMPAVIMRAAAMVERHVRNLTVVRAIPTSARNRAFTASHLSGYRSNMADPYSTLGVAKTASEADIKSAYRKLAKELHPDKNKDNPKASEKFSDVTKAYDILSDKTKRAQFDRGEIDGDGNPAMPFGYGGGGGFRGDQRSGPGGFSGFGN